MNLTYAAAIGAVSGLRSMTGPAVISGAANRGLLDLKETPLEWIASDSAADVTTLLAAGELLADKMPFMPNRTDTPSLMFRFLSGAVCGVAVVAKRKDKGEMALAALVGGAAAIVASYVGLSWRKGSPLPGFVAAVLEDGAAVSGGTALVSSLDHAYKRLAL